MTGIQDIWQHAHNMIRSARQIINENLIPLNLSSAEGNILLHLLTQGQEMGQEELVEQLDISKPAVSRALDTMEKKGFVILQQDVEDRRAHKVRLTQRALEIGPAVEQAYNQLYVVAMQGITQEELDYFIKLFSRMSDNFIRAQSKKKTGDSGAA